MPDNCRTPPFAPLIAAALIPRAASLAMKRPSRLPHGARWYALTRNGCGRRCSPSDVLKAALAVVMLLLVAWNVSVFTVVERHTNSGGIALQTPSQKLRANEAQHVPEPTTQSPAPLERPWFLDPNYYRQENGCDFSTAVELFDPRQLDINCGNIHELQLGESLGVGFWREVSRAVWKGRSVAVKIVKEKLLDRSDIIPRHVEEAAAMFPIRHEPNIVSLVGWCNTTVVVEYVPQKLDELVFDKAQELSVQRALELARDAARGLMQLHEARGGPYAHTDIQVRQFLVDWNGRLKLNDFNRVKYTGKCVLPGQESKKCLSPVSASKGKWRSPQEYLKQDIDERTDIYSLSLVLWSLRSREKPFDDLSREEVYERVPQGTRPPASAMADYPVAMQRLIQRSWDHDPAKRPTARQLAAEIDLILKSYVAKNKP